MTKAIYNKHFHYFNNFFQTIMEILVIMLYIHYAKCSIIEFFHTWIKKSDWPFLIENIKQNCIIIIRMCLIQRKLLHIPIPSSLPYLE